MPKPRCFGFETIFYFFSGQVVKEMDKMGEDLIWDALKLTGAHRDEKMSRKQLDHLKKQLIQRIGAAYR